MLSSSLTLSLIHIQFAVEATQCLGTLPIETSKLPFPAMTKSDIAIGKDATPYTMFAALYEKYIDSLAEWSINLPVPDWIIDRYHRCKEKQRHHPRHSTAVSEMFRMIKFPSIKDLSTKPLRRWDDSDKDDLRDITEALELILNTVTGKLEIAMEAFKSTDDIRSWYTNLKDDEKLQLSQEIHRKSISIGDAAGNVEKSSDDSQWKCDECGCYNRCIWISGRRKDPGDSCIHCGSVNVRSTTGFVMIDMEYEMEAIAEVDEDMEIVVQDWKAMCQEFTEDPESNQCHGREGTIINSCPKVQKMMFLMKCYAHYVGTPIGKDEERYSIKSMHVLVNRLLESDDGVKELIDMFQHVYDEHVSGGEEFSDFYGETFPETLRTNQYRRNRRRRDRRQAEDIEYVGPSGGIIHDQNERMTMGFFDQWHASLYNPILMSDVSTTGTSVEHERKEPAEDDEIQNKFWTDANLASARTEECGNYHQYGFGEQIKYHRESPGFENFKKELLENGIHPIKESAWTDTLEKAKKFAKSKSVQKKYRALKSDKKYGIKKGQVIGIENIIAIILYCNFDFLQAAFSKTFRRTGDADTPESIRQRHCDNFYWFGRYVVLLITVAISVDEFRPI